MSWSFGISYAADKQAAKDQVAQKAAEAGGHFPESAQAAVNAIIDALPDCENSTISVSTYGHFNGGEHRGTSNITVSVNNNFAETSNGPR